MTFHKNGVCFLKMITLFGLIGSNFGLKDAIMAQTDIKGCVVGIGKWQIRAIHLQNGFSLSSPTTRLLKKGICFQKSGISLPISATPFLQLCHAFYNCGSQTDIIGNIVL
jgi:hypothetical protein